MVQDRMFELLPPTQSRSHPDWALLLDAVGSKEFEIALKRFLSELSLPDGSVAFVHEALGKVTTDDSAAAAREQNAPQWFHFKDGPWRAAIGVESSRPVPWGMSLELNYWWAAVGCAAAAIWRRHIERSDALNEEPLALSSLLGIETCLTHCTQLSSREVQVCSRILMGMSSNRIGVDLNLAETTIKTHRKRAYQRLSIGSQRELIAWYLRTWSQWQRAGGGRPVT
jgi:DNA-binding CsgD family transcriptional regulator